MVNFKDKLRARLPRGSFVAATRIVGGGLFLMTLLAVYTVGTAGSVASSGCAQEGMPGRRMPRSRRALLAVATPVETQPSKELPGCILMFDHRFGWNEDDFKGWADGPSGKFEEQGRQVEYHRPARFINWMYAMRHGYRFASGNVTMFEKDRHPSWMKVAFMRHELKCCCKWAMIIDSDSYLRMETHKLRVEEWLMRVLTESVESENKQERQTVVPKDPLSFFSDKEDGIDMVIARNGDKSGGWQGDKDALERTMENDALCAGNFLFRRSKRSIQMLDDWYSYNGTLLQDHAWEQTPFNQMVYPKYKDHIAVVPFAEMGPNGRAVNHVWGADNKMEQRNEKMVAAAMGVIRSLPTDVLERIQNKVDSAPETLADFDIALPII